MSPGLCFQWYDIENDPLGWDGHVAGLGQNLFHRNAMLEVHQWSKAFRRGILITREGLPVGLVGGLLCPEHGGAWFLALSFPRPHADLDRTLPSDLSHWLLRQGVTRIDLGSFDGGIEGYEGERVGRVTERFEFLYDLTMSEDERLRRTNSNHRRKLKKAEREPLRMRCIDAGQAWLMARLNRAWARRKGESYSLLRMSRTYCYYRRLTSRLGRDASANLYGLYDAHDHILSMAYMLERGESSFYMIGASSEEGYERGAAVRLFWELARHYPSIGIRTMNLGGVPSKASEPRHEEHGVYRFKLGFGIEPTIRKSLIIEA